MDDDKKRKLESEMTSNDSSSWVDSSYFFGNEERERSILGEFGWNFSQQNEERTSFMEFEDHQIELQEQDQQQHQRSDLAGSFLLPENPSTSSSITTSTTTTIIPTTTVEKSGDASTPNPSVSTSSSDEQPEKSTGSDGKPPEKPSKGRKKGQKRIRQQRFAFMTKSDVDHLEDGYRWRKYGQKAVKNSPYPRSYYRCTNAKCTVKKRVERSCEDPAIVITTYEGQHCHHTVSFPRGSVFSHEGPFGGGLNPSSSQIYAPTMQYTVSGPLSVTQSHQPQVRPAQMQPQQTLRSPSSDEGLLGDIVPPGMRNR